MAASAAELTQQVLSLIEMNKELVEKVEALEVMNQELVKKVEELEAAVAAHGGGGGDGARGLVDVKKLFPEAFLKEEDFKDWKEDVMEWVDHLAPEMAAKLEQVALQDEEHELDMDENPMQCKLRRSLFPAFRKLVKLQEAKLIVRSVKNRNPFEAWRLLMFRYDR